MELALGGLEQVIGSAETGCFHFLVGKGLGGAETGEAALDLLIDMSHLFLGSFGGLTHAVAHGHHHRQEHRDGQRHDQRQLPADGEHHSQCTDDGQYGRQQVFRAMVGQFRQFKQIRGQAAHQLAGAVLIVKVKAQLLHMPE